MSDSESDYANERWKRFFTDKLYPKNRRRRAGSRSKSLHRLREIQDEQGQESSIYKHYCTCMWQGCPTRFEEKRLVCLSTHDAYTESEFERLNSKKEDLKIMRGLMHLLTFRRNMTDQEKSNISIPLSDVDSITDLSDQEQSNISHKKRPALPLTDGQPIHLDMCKECEYCGKQGLEDGQDLCTECRRIQCLGAGSATGSATESATESATDSDSENERLDDLSEKALKDENNGNESFDQKVKNYLKSKEGSKYYFDDVGSGMKEVVQKIRGIQDKYPWPPKNLKDTKRKERMKSYFREIKSQILPPLVTLINKLLESKPELKKKYVRKWMAAPLAAQYCTEHQNKREYIFHDIMIHEKALQATKADWLLFHPENDPFALKFLNGWLEESKKLFGLLHERTADINNAQIKAVYCVENKLSSVGRHSFCEEPQGKLLQLHGTRRKYVSDIIENDLNLSGTEVKIRKGKMLGEGVYMTESFVKAMKNSEPESRLHWIFVLEVESDASSASFENPSNSIDAKASDAEVILASGSVIFTEKIMVKSGWTQGCYYPSNPRPNEHNKFLYGKDQNQVLEFSEILVKNPTLWRIRYLIHVSSKEEN